VCDHCGDSAFKTEKLQTVCYCCSFPSFFFVSESLNTMRGMKRKGIKGRKVKKRKESKRISRDSSIINVISVLLARQNMFYLYDLQ
jgi:hypothetical protein